MQLTEDEGHYLPQGYRNSGTQYTIPRVLMYVTGDTAPDLKRFLTFFALFRQKKQLFQCYQEQEGEFLGDEELLASAGIPLTQADLAKWSDDDHFADLDREFA